MLYSYVVYLVSAQLPLTKAGYTVGICMIAGRGGTLATPDRR